jgi:hypothetical protein
MPDQDPAIDDVIREIAAILAAAYLALRFGNGNAKRLDCSPAERPHVIGRSIT